MNPAVQRGRTFPAIRDVARTECWDPDEMWAQSGAIRLSANEWKQARKFGDRYWLYIVTQAATGDPQVHPLRDPASRFQVGEDIFSTGFIIPEDRWRERTER